MSVLSTYRPLESSDHWTKQVDETSGDSDEQNEESGTLGGDILDDSLTFRQPKARFIRSVAGSCILAKKKCASASRTVVKFAFGRWPVALAVLIGYICLTCCFIAIAVTGRYHEFKNDISLNSFMVPDIKVSREFSTFNTANEQDKGSFPPLFAVKVLLEGKACPEDNAIHQNSRVRRHKREIPNFMYQGTPSWTLDLVYEAKGSNDSNIFTRERLRAVHDIEQKLMKHTDFNKHCYISRLSRSDSALEQFGYCMPPNSLTAFFFPSKSGNYDGQGKTLTNIEDTLKFLQSRVYFYSFVSEGYSTQKKQSRFLRAQLLFGKPVKGIPPSKEAQKAEFKKFIRTFIEPLEKINNDDKVNVLYGGGDLFDYLVERALYSDLRLALISLGLIILLLLILTFSLWLSFMAVLSILSSVAVAYFFYRVVFGIEYMGILNGVSLFVIIGIGVDDIFVFINTFRQAVDNKDLGDRIYHTISVAGKATLFTSFTTAAAFAANALSPIPAIHDFGLFMAILVASCWVSVLFIMAPALCLWNTVIEKLEVAVFKKLLSLIGLQRSERLRLPDDIRQFLSGNPNGYHSNEQLCDDSDSMELHHLVDNEDGDDDDPLLVIDNESPHVSEQPMDSLGFRMQSILFHFVAEPVVKARYFILVTYLVLFAGSVFLVTKIKVSTEQPKIFQADSNLQRWLELPEVSLHPSNKMVGDLMALAHNRVPGEPKFTRADHRRTTTSPIRPRTRQPLPTPPESTTVFATLRQTHATSKAPSTRKTMSTKRHERTTNPITTARTDEIEHKETTMATLITTTSDLQTEKTESSGHLRTEENGMVTGGNGTSPTDFPVSPTIDPCYKCGPNGRCEVKNGTASCKCNIPYTGSTCSIYCPVRTMAGNCCQIPFTYKNKQQYGCSIDEDKKLSWCYDRDGTKGFCNTTVENQCKVRTLTPNKTCCTFPFVYKSVQYYYCIKIKQFAEDTYCGTQRQIQNIGELHKCNISRPPSWISKLCSKQDSCKAAKKPADGTTALVYLVFGLHGLDTKSIDRRHVLKQKEGTIKYDDNFAWEMSCSTKKMFKAACWICKKFASNNDLVIPGGADCFPSSVRNTLAAMFPDDCEDLPRPHRTQTKAKSIVVIKNDTKLKWFAMTFQSTTGKLASYRSQQKDYMKWENFMKEMISDKMVPGAFKNGFLTSETWLKMFSGMIVVDSAVYGIVVSLVLCLAAVVIFTGHALLFVVLFMTIIGVLLMVIAIFYLTGWQLGGVEAVSLSILVGTSVDYCFHLVEGYILAGQAVRPSLDAEESRHWRAKAAMSHIGMSIISSAITTILAAIPLCFTQIQLFAKFGLIVTINTAISLLYTMTVTMALLSIMGPARFRASVCACLIGVAVVAVFGGLAFLIMYLLSSEGGYCIPSPEGTPLFNC